MASAGDTEPGMRSRRSGRNAVRGGGSVRRSVRKRQRRRRRLAGGRVGQRPNLGLDVLIAGNSAEVMQITGHRRRSHRRIQLTSVEIGDGNGNGDAVLVDLGARSAAHRRVRRHGTARIIVAVALIVTFAYFFAKNTTTRGQCGCLSVCVGHPSTRR